MNDENADFLFGELETSGVGRQQIKEQHPADEIATRKHGQSQFRSRRRPPNEHAPKITVLRRPKPFLPLGQRPDENQHEGQAQEKHRQTQRTDHVQKPVDALPKRRRGARLSRAWPRPPLDVAPFHLWLSHCFSIHHFAVVTNSTNPCFSASTAAGSPSSLKNQVSAPRGTI